MTDIEKGRIFRSYEELERELMPKRARERRAEPNGHELRKEWLKILRRTIADAAGEKVA